MALILTVLLGSAAVRAYPTTDLFCFVTAARLVSEGADPYDHVVWTAATSAESPDYRGVLRGTSCLGRYAYPLWTAVVLVPFAWIDAAWVPLIWQVLLFVGTGAGVATLASAVGRPDRRLALGLAVCISQPFWLAVLNAQFGGILLGVVGATALLAARQRDVAAGASLAVTALKPHVAVLAFALPVRALRSERPRMALAAMAVLLVAVAASIAVRPGWILEYAAELVDVREAQTATSTSLYALSSALAGSPAVGIATVLGVVVGVLALLRHCRLTDPELLAVGLSATLVLSPHLGSHDHLLLAPAWAVILAAPRWWSAILVTLLAVALPWSLYAFRNSLGGPEGLSGLLPTVTSIALALVVRTRRGDVPR